MRTVVRRALPGVVMTGVASVFVAGAPAVAHEAPPAGGPWTASGKPSPQYRAGFEFVVGHRGTRVSKFDGALAARVTGTTPCTGRINPNGHARVRRGSGKFEFDYANNTGQTKEVQGRFLARNRVQVKVRITDDGSASGTVCDSGWQEVHGRPVP